MRVLDNCKLCALGTLADFDRSYSATCRSCQHNLRAGTCGDSFSERIVGIQNHCSLRLNCFGQCSLFKGNCLAGTHEFDVCHADVGDDRCVRRGDLRECCDFAGMIHSDLPDGNFILGSRFQNCAWQTYVIVVFTFGLGYPKFSCEHRCSEVFCACLAIAADDREDFQPERPPVICCQRLVGLERIGRTQKCEMVRDISSPFEVNECACSPAFCTNFDKIVAFEIFAAQRDEQFTRLNRAGIGADLVDYDCPVTG